MAKAKTQKKIIINAKQERNKSGLNQHDFWTRFGVTQSGGSRYESGRSIPKPVRILMAIGLGLADANEIASGAIAARI